jgi:putative restriction endonuclease
MNLHTPSRRNSAERTIGSSEQLLHTLGADVVVWRRGDQRAPHKPLLVLLALGRVARKEPRLVAFQDIEPVLRRLLLEFGPTRASYHPEYPFWRLQRDGIWEVVDSERLKPRRSNTDPSVRTLRPAMGGFTQTVDAALRRDPALLRRVGALMLEAHFPESLHAPILTAVGLSAEGFGHHARDRRFRELVLRAYGYRCTACGFDATLDGVNIGLDAAHIHWSSANGPDVVTNGLALCAMHHRAFDLGLFTIDPEETVVVSARLNGGPAVEAALGTLHGRKILAPVHGHPSADQVRTAWHRAEVFKGPGRAR